MPGLGDDMMQGQGLGMMMQGGSAADNAPQPMPGQGGMEGGEGGEGQEMLGMFQLIKRLQGQNPELAQAVLAALMGGQMPQPQMPPQMPPEMMQGQQPMGMPY